MLTIRVPFAESWDEEREEFVTFEPTVLELEHSLVALSKWESKFEKPFLATPERTDAEALYYVECMVTSSGVPSDVFERLTPENMTQITEYLQSKQTATWFNDTSKQPGPGRRETITAEVMYYWLVALQIDFQVQYWHLNRLLTLVRVTNQKNAPTDKKKPPTRDALAERRRLNDQRRAQLGTSG